MSYLTDTIEPLTKVLLHHAELPKHQFAGHVANIDFWVSEVLHGLAVIDGYPARFKAMRDAQLEHESHSPQPLADPAGHVARVGRDLPPRRSTSDDVRKELRRSLLDAAHSLFDRVEREHLLANGQLEELRRRVSSAASVA